MSCYVDGLKVFLGTFTLIGLGWLLCREAKRYVVVTWPNKRLLEYLKRSYEEMREDRLDFEQENETDVSGKINAEYQKMLRLEAGILMQIAFQFPDEYVIYGHHIRSLVDKMDGTVIY